MTTFKKILFPVDFSERSIGAARYVEAVAGWFEAEIMLLHVIDTGSYWYPEEAQPYLKHQLEHFLEYELRYFNTQRVCVTGDPGAKIAEVAKSWPADLVMMPTRGLGTFRRFLLGSATAKVLHDTSCPVWTGVHTEEAPRLEEIGCAKVLCAIDLGERSAQVLEWAAFMAQEHQAALGIVHAIPAEAMAAVTPAAETRIRELQTAAGTNAAVLFAPGDPAQAVACAAKEFGADLLVIGRHNGLRQRGYAILRESHCPVISV